MPFSTGRPSLLTSLLCLAWNSTCDLPRSIPFGGAAAGVSLLSLSTLNLLAWSGCVFGVFGEPRSNSGVGTGAKGDDVAAGCCADATLQHPIAISPAIALRMPRFMPRQISQGH
jgi:hypothetical protein